MNAAEQKAARVVDAHLKRVEAAYRGAAEEMVYARALAATDPQAAVDHLSKTHAMFIVLLTKSQELFYASSDGVTSLPPPGSA